MATVVTDIFESQLKLTGVEQFVAGMREAAGGTANLQNAMSRLSAAGDTMAQRAGQLTRFLVQSGMAAGEGAAAFEAASKQFGGSFPKEELVAFAGEMQKYTGIADNTIASQLGLLAAYGVTGEQSKKLIIGITNTAEAMKGAGFTAESLAQQIGSALETGELGRLDKRLGVDETRFKVDRLGAILEALGAKGKQAAFDFRETLPGSVLALQTAVGAFQQALGQPLVEPLTRLANFVVSLSEKFTKLRPPVQAAVTYLGVGLVGVLSLASIAAKALAAQTLFLMNAQLGGAAAAVKYGKAQAGATVAMGGGYGWRGRLGRAVGFGTAAVGADMASEAMGRETTGGKIADILNKAFWGAAAVSIVSKHPLALLAGAVAGGGIGAYQSGMLGGQGEPGEKPGGKGVLDMLAELVGLQRQSNEKLDTLHGDMRAGIGSQDVLDVMGEARTFRILAGRLGG